MELRNLTTFTKIAQTKNFTKAAAQLGYSQSAISSQIQQLEKELGVPVFDRIGKTVSLTQAGEILYQYANAMLTLEQNAIDSIRNQVTLAGELRIAIEESLSISFLPDILHHYRSQYPNVDLIVTAADSRQMFHMLKENEIDMIYTLDRINTQPGLIVPRYLEEPILFIAPVSHSFCMEDSVSLETLLKEPFLLTNSESSYRDELERLLNQKDLSIRPLLEINNTDTICRLVSMGIGLSFVPECVAKPYIEDGTISSINVPEINIHMYRQLLYHKDKWQTPQMQAMVKLLLEIDF